MLMCTVYGTKIWILFKGGGWIDVCALLIFITVPICWNIILLVNTIVCFPAYKRKIEISEI